MHAFAYAKPATTSEAARAAAADGAKLLAGGQTLLSSMKLGLAAPESLVDLAGIAALKGISLTGGVAAHRADAQHAAGQADALERGDAGQVNQRLGRGQAEIGRAHV